MRRRAALLLVVVSVLGACGSSPRPGRTLRVFAASSLTEAFATLAPEFESAHDGVRVRFNFAASSALAEQIDQGAPADVFVSADESNMQKVVDAGEVAAGAAPTVVARNRLEILVEDGNPKGIRSLADLARPGTVVVLCAPEVPCGKYASAALAMAHVTLKPASLEENVKAVVTKVTLGEADAGIVYVTDVKAAGTKAEGVPIDIADAPALQAVYPASVLAAAHDRDLATAWLTFLQSAPAQRTLASFGFLPP